MSVIANVDQTVGRHPPMRDNTPRHTTQQDGHPTENVGR